MIEHGTSRTGRWLAARRVKLALAIAIAEAIIVALEDSVSRWTVIIIAVPLIALYVYAGRNWRSDTARQVAWIAAASQALAVVAVILAFILGWLALILAGLFAAIAIAFLLFDRR